MTCSYCKKDVRCYLKCDNDCDHWWCSDECADADKGHHKRSQSSISLWIRLLNWIQRK